MKLSKLQMMGGLSLIIGSVLLAAYSVLFFTLLPVTEIRNDVTLAIQDPNWIWVSLLAFIGVILMMFGFTVVYSKIYSESGMTGFLGYLFIEIAYLFQACKVTWEVFLYPVIAGNQSSIVLFKENIIRNSLLVGVFKDIASLAIFAGIVLFCYMLVRSKEFPKIAGALIFAGALLYGLGPLLSIFIAIGGIIILASGCLIIGMKLIKNFTEN
jgi:hypothetical protein